MKALSGPVILPQPQLVFDQIAHRYTLEGVWLPNVTRVLEGAGLIDYGFLGERRELYLTRGHAVHLSTRYDDEGDLAEGSVSDEICSYLQAWRAFRRDYGFVPRLIEHRVYNPQFNYAGTLDRVGSVRDGSEFLVDIKSGTVPDATPIQLAAYSGCLRHPRARLRRCVELHANATYKVIPYQMSDYQRDFHEFVTALETFRAKEQK
jgi:hypothetical protein